MNHLKRLVAWIIRRKKMLLLLLLAAALLVAGRLLDMNTYLQAAQEWIWRFGPWGPAVFVGLYAAAMLVLLPGMPFTVLAAFLFGNLWGFLTMMAATTLSATLSFVIARYLARDWVERHLSRMQTIEQLKEMVERNHWFAIPFIRLMPIFPFAVNNYAFGLTTISYVRYLLLSLMVFIPMNAALVLGANSLYAALTGGDISWPIMGGAAGAALVVLAIGYAGKRMFGTGSNTPAERRNATEKAP